MGIIFIYLKLFFFFINFEEMSFTGFDMQGGVNQCYPFFQRLTSCIKGEVIPIKMCANESEDYLECLHRTKQYQLNYKILEEIHKYKILSIPVYDEENDKFVINNVTENADSSFAKK